VWCSASSSGEEAWSIAMVLARGAPDWLNQDVKVLATDIDTNVLQIARNASYPASLVAAVPDDFRGRFLVQDRDSRGASYSLRPDLRAMVSFARLNLTQLPYPMRGPFDVIFCRNVLIYFDHETRTQVIKAMLDLLDPRGILVLGPSESALGLDHLVIRTTDSVYQRRELR
jgi:chemotaxis protein methyltransferase CheR